MPGTVRPVLFVGCGGSGGVTLRFTMDALRAETRRANDARAAADGEAARLDFSASQGLPRCWQFLHIDVPSAPDGNSADRPDSVPEQGGRYVSIAPAGFEYKSVSNQLWARASGKPTRPLLTGWMKVPNPATDPHLSAGAGQMRNVGRVVTLYSLGKINEGLDAASRALVSADARDDLSKLATLSAATSIPEPLVIFVSSMSGGAGASMVLDVSRALSLLRPTWVAMTAMFLYTSEVFSELEEIKRTGVEGNGLAALGELLATSLGANGQRAVHAGDSPARREAARLEALQDENRLLADLGLAAGAGGESQTYKRVFPIGNTQGPNAALFGSGKMDVVYRAVGRGLAGLVASPTALSDFTSYDMVNANFLPTQLDWLGTGGPSEQSVLWGSFGFGRLSLGRDRYGEYLAQRIARDAVDRLSGSTGRGRASAERDAAMSAEAAHQSLLSNLGLPDSSRPVTLKALLGRATSPEQADADLVAPVRQHLSERLYRHPQVQMAANPRDFPPALLRVGSDVALPLMTTINELGYRMVYEWLHQLVTDCVRGSEDVAARRGLPVARQVTLRLRDDAAQWSRALVAEGRRAAPDRGANLPLPPAAGLDAISKLPTFGLDHPMREQLVTAHVALVAGAAAGRMGVVLGEALAEFGDRLALPLARALQARTGVIDAARQRVPEGGGVAEARSDVYAEWPTRTGDVPIRFHGAHNEVMLIDPLSFPDQVSADLEVIRAARGLATPAEAGETMLVEVLTDRWTAHNDDTATSRTITTTSAWVPSAMVRDPDRPDLARVATAAAFEIQQQPEQVIRRAREWVLRPNGELAPFLRQGIRGYLDGADGEPDPQRTGELARKFGMALQHAAPLVQVSAPAFGIVHQGVALQEMFKFSGVPLEGLAGAPSAQLRTVLQDYGNVATESLAGYDAALDQNEATQHVDIFGSYAPMSPLAISSLLKPLSSALARSVASGHVDTLWHNRRARPLSGCLPLAPDERRALVAGFIVGRMTGRVRGTYVQDPIAFNEPLAVYAEAEGGQGDWLTFPKPLLTPHLTDYDGDEVAALLESHLVAIAQCGFDTNLAPLQVFRALRRLFAQALRVGDADFVYDRRFGAVRHLRRYILVDERVPGGGPRRAELGAPQGSPPVTPAERKAAALRYLEEREQAIISGFGGEDPSRSPYIESMRYNIRPLMSSLAPDLVWSMRTLRSDIEAIDPDEPLTDGDRPRVGGFSL